MDAPAGPAPDGEVPSERRRLVSLAFRMLGTIAEAEDAVQETYARWYRLTEAERAEIRIPGAWLTRVASRVCLDMLTSARARREQYVGPWLPEPVPEAAFSQPVVDPLDRVTLDESVSTALLVVLESMTPAERVAFVLHDVFSMPFEEIAETVGRTPAAARQLAASARRRVRTHRRSAATRDEHGRVVRAFARAAQEGDLAGLVAVLDPAAVLRSDGGGLARAALNPIIGPDRVARFLIGVRQKSPDAELVEQATADGLGIALWREGRVYGVLTFDVADGAVRAVRMMVNPRKLRFWV